jgi:hypothetical protein
MRLRDLVHANRMLRAACIMSGSRVGGIAQLGERLHGMQEVSGSIPLTSTTTVVPIV